MRSSLLPLVFTGLVGLVAGFALRPLVPLPNAGSSEVSRPAPRAVHFSMKDARWDKYPDFGGAEWVIYRSPDGKRVAAAWQESGKHTFTYPFDEFVYVVKGRAKVKVHGGESFEIVEGDVAYFEEGMTVDFEMSDGFTDVTMLVSDKAVKWR